MGKEIYKHQDLTYKIIGCSMQVHSTLGNGFQEVIYQRALAIELRRAGIPYQRELEMPIYYRGRDIGKRRVDFLVDNQVMVELKALSELEKTHLAQTLNYLEIYQLEIGLLINFGSTSLQFKRIIHTPESAATIWTADSSDERMTRIKMPPPPYP
ncbi:MAG: GxxExxY protein [Myxococcota bacterium]